jgi:hypothetical protein
LPASVLHQRLQRSPKLDGPVLKTQILVIWPPNFPLWDDSRHSSEINVSKKFFAISPFKWPPPAAARAPSAAYHFWEEVGEDCYHEQGLLPKTSGLGAPKRTQMAATAIPARSLFYMICCKAYYILLGRATVLFCTCILPPHPNATSQHLPAMAQPPFGRRRRPM